MKKKNKKYLSALGVFFVLQDVGLPENFVFTGPNQTIEFTQDNSQVPHNLTNKYPNNTLALYYPTRPLENGFKKIHFYCVDSSKYRLNFMLFSDPNHPQVIDGKTLYSDYISVTQGSIFGSAPLWVVFALGTKATDIKNIAFFGSRFNSGILFSNGMGFLDFTKVQLGVDFVVTKENSDLDFIITHAKEVEIMPSDQTTGIVATTFNHNLYLATLGSLTQRTKELHNTPYTQGVWANIANIGQTSKIDLGLKSNYTSLQLGYDYDLGSVDYKNLLGVAFSYTLGIPSVQSKIFYDNQARIFENIRSHAVEFAIYNSYMQQKGWFNDTIAKLGYFKSTFDITNLNRNTTTSNQAGNIALSLIDSFGYAFKLGKMNEWSITPQAEVAIGWIQQGEFKQSYEGSSEFLKTLIQTTFVFKGKLGSSFGYDFKHLIPKKDVNTSVYIGMFYEYLYTKGGDILINTTNLSTQKNSSPLFDEHFLISLGTHIQAQKYLKIYCDFEKSFYGKISKDYQISLGVRYSFGENSTKNKQIISNGGGGKRNYPL